MVSATAWQPAQHMGGGQVTHMDESTGVTIGLDIGTTSVKAVAADPAGSVLASARIDHPVITPSPGVLEHDAALAWRDGVLAAGGGGSHWQATDTYKVMNFTVLAIGLFFLLKKPVAQALNARIDGIKEQLGELEAQKKAAEDAFRFAGKFHQDKKSTAGRLHSADSCRRYQ